MRRWAIAAAVVAILAAAGLYWFQPWKLITSTTVNDAVPAIRSSAATPADTPTAAAAEEAILVARGDLISHEHATSGTAQLVRLPDGHHQLILQTLSTSDGPDLRVWLTDRPVLAGSQGQYVFDDGFVLELGALKGNHGTQVYDVPSGTDVSMFRSVTIWCKRFAVSFGAAELARV